MKCPLYCIGRTMVIPREEAEIGDCLEKECAWWDKEHELCAISSLPNEIGMLQWELQELRGIMPRADQFRKEP